MTIPPSPSLQDLVFFVGGAEMRSAKDLAETKVTLKAILQLVDMIARAESEALAEKRAEEEAERQLEEDEVRRHQEGLERQAMLAAKRKAEMEERTGSAARLAASPGSAVNSARYWVAPAR